jgi:O-acetyl-ADP-ribose deacetylase (regulator of RNase III)
MLKPSNHIIIGSLKVVNGDVTKLQGGGLKYLIQIVNDTGKYGAGVSGAISKAWPKVEQEYRQLWRERYGKLKLGDVQFIQVTSDLVIVNMIAQHSIISNDNPKPIKFDALQSCLSKVGIEASETNGTIHMPRIGCKRAGATWEEVAPLVEAELQKRGLKVIVYDYDE